jgi:acyl carrier protein
MDKFQIEIAQLIISALNLRDIALDQLTPATPLFSSGLGLDSVDILELGVVLDERYGVRIKSEDPEHRQAFETIASLAAFVARERSNAA